MRHTPTFLLLLFLLFFLLALCHASSVTMAYTPKPVLDCRLVFCPRPLCADPVIPPGECCPSCENSKCKFRGCVNIFGNGEIFWQPSPCITCQCFDGQEICAVVACIELTEEDCFGFPVVTRPWECCPSCDFGIPDNKCAAVPQVFSQKNLTVTTSNQFVPKIGSCTEKIVEHTCDKEGFRVRGKTYRCVERKGKRIVRFDKNCPLCVGLYKDVLGCKAVRDDNILIGCDFIVGETHN